jgi:hypothetical protein
MRVLAAAAFAASIALTIGSSQTANAASLLSISGGSDLVLSPNSDLVPTPNPAFQELAPLAVVIDDADYSGLFARGGAQLSTTADNVTLSYDYIGSFAGATNSFNAPGGSFTTLGLDEGVGGDSTARPDFSVTQALAGLVGFGFSTSLDGSSVDNAVANNPAGAGAITFAASYLELREGEEGVLWEISDTPTNAVLLLLDDSGAGSDSDYDDLGVVLVATPIPASLPLFGTALVGLWLLGWRWKMRS